MAHEPWFLALEAAAERFEQRQHAEAIRSELEFALESQHWFDRREADCG